MESSPHWHAVRQRQREFGRGRRRECKRSSHGEVIVGSPDRDPLALIEDSNVGRIKHLLPTRFTRMSESPFAFFRGTAVVQAHDLMNTPTSSIIVQSCGDCHLMNFGAFSSPERTLLFDINDFDETLPAPFEWDVKRLAASGVLAARWRRFSETAARRFAAVAAAGYRVAMNLYASMTVLDIWYERMTFEGVRTLMVDDAKMTRRFEFTYTQKRWRFCTRFPKMIVSCARCFDCTANC